MYCVEYLGELPERFFEIHNLQAGKDISLF